MAAGDHPSKTVQRNSDLETIVEVRGGGAYNSTLPTLSDGDKSQPQFDSRGRLIITKGTGDGRALDAVSVSLATDAIMNNKTELTPKFARVTSAAGGDVTAIAAVTGKKLRLLGLVLSAPGGANSVRIESSTTSRLIEQIDLADNETVVLPFTPIGWGETVAGELMNLEISAATLVTAAIVYVEV